MRSPAIEISFTRWKVAISLLAVVVFGCDGSEPRVAEYCAAVNVHGDEGERLVKMIDEFAAMHDLVVDKTHPIVSRYADDKGALMISTRLEMGRFGAIISVYVLDEENLDADVIVEELIVYVNDAVASKYLVTRCNDIDGFQKPVVWN